MLILNSWRFRCFEWCLLRRYGNSLPQLLPLFRETPSRARVKAHVRWEGQRKVAIEAVLARPKAYIVGRNADAVRQRSHVWTRRVAFICSLYIEMVCIHWSWKLKSKRRLENSYFDPRSFLQMCVRIPGRVCSFVIFILKWFVYTVLGSWKGRCRSSARAIFWPY